MAKFGNLCDFATSSGYDRPDIEIWGQLHRLQYRRLKYKKEIIFLATAKRLESFKTLFYDSIKNVNDSLKKDIAFYFYITQPVDFVGKIAEVLNKYKTVKQFFLESLMFVNHSAVPLIARENLKGTHENSIISYAILFPSVQQMEIIGYL